MRRSTFVEMGGFSSAFRRLEDVEFLIRSIQRGYTISGSSSIGVIRYDVAGNHNTGHANRDGELQLLKKYSPGMLTKRESLHSRFWLMARADYFHKNYVRAILLLILSFLVSPIRVLYRSMRGMPKRISLDRNLQSFQEKRP